MEDVVKQDMINAFSATSINEDYLVDEQTTSGDAGQYVQPQVWAKNEKNWRAFSKDFPKYGGPGAKYVKVKDKCRTFPYCNQGDINALDFFEPVKRKRKKKSKKTKLTPLGRRKRKIAKNLVRTQKIKTPRGKHYNIGRRISESNRYLYYNNELTQQEVDKAILENTMKNKINNPKTQGKNLEDNIKKQLKIVSEQKAFKDPQGGYKTFQKMHAESGDHNAEGIKLAAEKIKKFMKDDSGMDIAPPMYRNTTTQDEFIEDVYYSSGQSGLKYDQPLSDETKERHEKYLKGSPETGNAVKGGELDRVGPGGAVSNVMTKNSEGGANTAGEMLSKAAKRRAKKEAMGMRMANNDRRYTPDTVTTSSKPIVQLDEHIIDTGEQILKLIPESLKKNGQKFKVTNGKQIKECIYESFINSNGGQVIIINSKNPNKLTEQMVRMKQLFNYDINKKHDKFR
tara:strand:- start:231 stop:1592 length:1362 start_codon:yes stop_codon:yes gene_type:complete